MTTASDVVKQVLGHMTSNDNPSHITVKKGQLRSVLFLLVICSFTCCSVFLGVLSIIDIHVWNA